MEYVKIYPGGVNPNSAIIIGVGVTADSNGVYSLAAEAFHKSFVQPDIDRDTLADYDVTSHGDTVILHPKSISWEEDAVQKYFREATK